MHLYKLGKIYRNITWYKIINDYIYNEGRRCLTVNTINEVRFSMNHLYYRHTVFTTRELNTSSLTA
jgi:hypothetical protein